jgi:hypothetical protein
MMDSQENTLEQGKTENVNNVDETVNTGTQPIPTAENAVEASDSSVTNTATEEPKAETTADVLTKEPEQEAEEQPKKVYKTKKEVLERVKEIAQSDENPSKDEIDYLKTLFYKMHIAEREAEQKAYIDNGGDPEKYQVLPDEDEESFKAEMIIIKEKRAKVFLQQEAEKEENLKKKLDIIEHIKAIATSPDEANKSYQDFKKLQQEWKEIKSVPAEKANELWRNYQLYVEQFYDLLKLNSEAREYDFKKNLEIKNKLCIDMVLAKASAATAKTAPTTPPALAAAATPRTNPPVSLVTFTALSIRLCKASSP